MTTYTPRWSGDTKKFPGNLNEDSAAKSPEKQKSDEERKRRTAEKPQEKPPARPKPSPNTALPRQEKPLETQVGEPESPGADAKPAVAPSLEEPAENKVEPKRPPEAGKGGKRRAPEFLIDAAVRHAAASLIRFLDRIKSKRENDSGERPVSTRNIVKAVLTGLVFLILIEQFTDISVGMIVLVLILVGGTAFLFLAHLARNDLPMRRRLRDAFPSEDDMVVGPIVDMLTGNAAEDLMPDICALRGDMAYLADVADEFDASLFGQSDVFAAFYQSDQPLDMNQTANVFSDLLEGRYKGLTFAVVNADIRKGWASVDKRSPVRIFNGFLLRIQSPRPVVERIRLRPSKGVSKRVGDDDGVFDPNWIGSFFEVGPKDIVEGLRTILEGKEFNAVLFRDEFLLAVETHEKLFWVPHHRSGGRRHSRLAMRETLQEDAGIPVRVIELLGWRQSTVDLDAWEPSWTAHNATREAIGVAALEKRQGEPRPKQAGAPGEIIENDDGTFSVDGRTYKSRSSAEAYLELIERTQKWAETE